MITKQLEQIDPPKPGLYHNVPFEVYRSWNAVNNSVLKILSDDRQCPAHAQYYIENGREDTPALKFGRAMDAYILEPLRFFDWYVVCPDCDKRTKEGKAVYADFVATAGGKEIITQSDMDKIVQIAQSVSNSQAMRLIQGGQSQVCAVWIDKETGLTCKTRYDYYQKNLPMITDLKSTSDCSPSGFAFDIFKYSYFQQAGFYCEGHEVLTGDDSLFAIFAIEKEPPFVHASYELGMRTIEAGKNAARRALRKYKECVETGIWPMYNDKITMLDMPVFAQEKFGVNPYEMR